MTSLGSQTGDSNGETFEALILESGLLEVAAGLLFEILDGPDLEGPDSPKLPSDIAFSMIDRAMHLIAATAPPDLSQNDVWMGAMRIAFDMVSSVTSAHLPDGEAPNQ